MADYINKIRTTEGDKPVNYEALANKPNSLPNPNKIKFTGSVVAEYDGSSEVTVNIPNGASEEQTAQIQTNTNDISELKNKTSELKGDKVCQCCGSDMNIDIHHINPYATHKSLRTDVNNGIALCELHHSSMILGGFHQTYGTRNNTPEQLLEYIKTKRKELGITDTSFIKSPLLLEHIEEL